MEEKKKCKYCQSEINKKATVCPVCKKEVSNVNSIVAVIIAVIIGLTFIFIGESDNDLSSIIENEQIEEFSLSKETAGYSDGFAFYIEGGIRNNTNKQYSYVQVSFNLYDKNGVQIGTALANVNNLEPNGVWKFKAIGLGGEANDVKTYKLMEIVGY